MAPDANGLNTPTWMPRTFIAAAIAPVIIVLPISVSVAVINKPLIFSIPLFL